LLSIAFFGRAFRPVRKRPGRSSMTSGQIASWFLLLAGWLVLARLLVYIVTLHTAIESVGLRLELPELEPKRCTREAMKTSLMRCQHFMYYACMVMKPKVFRSIA
jgi:hypothetical protein